LTKDLIHSPARVSKSLPQSPLEQRKRATVFDLEFESELAILMNQAEEERKLRMKAMGLSINDINSSDQVGSSKF
jgi:hypothetical protein